MIMRRILFLNEILFSEAFESTVQAISAHTIFFFFFYRLSFFFAKRDTVGEEKTITN